MQESEAQPCARTERGDGAASPVYNNDSVASLLEHVTFSPAISARVGRVPSRSELLDTVSPERHCVPPEVALEIRAQSKLVVAFVGLPARGKSFLSRRICTYLMFRGLRSRIFNLGSYRRRIAKERNMPQDASFFDPTNAAGSEIRHQVAVAALADMISWLEASPLNGVAIFDGTNTTKERRAMIADACSRHNLQLMYCETIRTRKDDITDAVRESKFLNGDYDNGTLPEEAFHDFLRRITFYESVYQPVDFDGSEANTSYVKFIDLGEKVILNRINRSLPMVVSTFCMNLRSTTNPIYLCRHGESVFNREGRIGGDPDLTANGRQFAQRLARWLRTEMAAQKKFRVWTSTLKRTVQTTSYIHSVPVITWPALCEINSGKFNGWTYTEVKEKEPAEHQARLADKLNYRYPQGESYVDLIHRLDPILLELARLRHGALILSHQAVLRVLYGYMMSLPPEEVPTIDIPMHTVIRMTPKGYTFVAELIPLGPDITIEKEEDTVSITSPLRPVLYSDHSS
eukprot:gnl/Spiro4/15396_TR8285_c0_g1_i1.p1 gnl/Spiro4/15396_TR8285_c0_g1~~gnl/Spiro4/15396_TR8285_c0_g1_i1.p1  ORF type:complete len:516 (+),score=128.55 gnl/Spiro4/15396_TR8285_c0_g1_i1:97-1644(+)